MKLSPREAPGYFAKPDPRRTGLLIYGPDGMRVALKRQEVIAALIGPEGEAEMRLSRIPGGDLRKEPTLLIDAVNAGDYSLVLAVATVSVTAVAVSIFIVDLLYPILDPRVRAE